MCENTVAAWKRTGKNYTSYIRDEVDDIELLSDLSRLYNADENSLFATNNKVISYKGAYVV